MPEDLAERLLRDEARLAADEARLRKDEERLDEDERMLRSNRLLTRIAIGLGATLVVAVAGLVLALVALNRDIDVVARAAPKPNSVGTSAIQTAAVTSDAIAPEAVTAAALAPGAVTRDAIAASAVGGGKIAAGAVHATDVAHNALTGAQVAESTLARVPSARHAASAANASALAGLTAGAYVSSVRTVVRATRNDRRATKGPFAARCPRGTRVLSGGARIDGASRGVAIVRSSPSGGTAWVAAADVYRAPGAPWRLVATALCGSGGR